MSHEHSWTFMSWLFMVHTSSQCWLLDGCVWILYWWRSTEHLKDRLGSGYSHCWIDEFPPRCMFEMASGRTALAGAKHTTKCYCVPMLTVLNHFLGWFLAIISLLVGYISTSLDAYSPLLVAYSLLLVGYFYLLKLAGVIRATVGRNLATAPHVRVAEAQHFPA